MKRSKIAKKRQRIILIATVVVIVAMTGIGGYLYSHNTAQNQTQSDKTSATKSSQSQNSQQSSASSQETKGEVAETEDESSYLVIPEWGVKALLPQNLQEMVTYQLSDITTGPDGRDFQAAKILLNLDAIPGNTCGENGAAKPGALMNTGAQYLRSNASEPFDSERYRWEFEKNILQTELYNYHLNYVLLQDCVGDTGSDMINELFQVLINLVET